MALITRRSLISGLFGIVAAPAIVRASSLMAVKAFAEPEEFLQIRTVYADEFYAAPFEISGIDTATGLRETYRMAKSLDGEHFTARLPVGFHIQSIATTERLTRDEAISLKIA